MSINLIYISLFASLLVFLNYKFRNIIASLTGLVDIPDNIRKFHKKKTPLNGSFPIVIIIIFYFYFFERNNIFLGQILNVSVVLFVVGILDDKIKISYEKKFFLFIIILFIFLNLYPNLLISKIYFETTNVNITLIKKHSTILTLICILLLINAFNFSDGINGLSSLIASIWLIFINYFFNNAHENYINVLIICILVNAVPIYKGKYFLGDSGTLFLSSIIAFITIKSFNQNSINFSYEKIFLLFLIPGVDMLRLFVLRIANKKNPFLADRNHLHHILLDRFSLLKTNLVYLALIVIPLFIQILLNIQIIFCIIIGLIAYMIIILLKKL